MPETQTLPDDFIDSWARAIGTMPQTHFLGVMTVLDEAFKLGIETAFRVLKIGSPQNPRLEPVRLSEKQRGRESRETFEYALPIDLTPYQLKHVTALMHGYHCRFRVAVATEEYQPTLERAVQRKVKMEKDDIVLEIWWRTLHFVRRTLKCVLEMEKDSERTTTVVNELFRLASLTRKAFEEGDTDIMNLNARLVYNFYLAELLKDRPDGRPKPTSIKEELELFYLKPLAFSRNTSLKQQDRKMFKELADSALTIIYHQVMHYVFYSEGFERIDLYRLQLIASSADLGRVYSGPR